MIYNGKNMTETIWFSPLQDADDVHCIELTRADDKSIFYVTACCNEDWMWAFNMDGLSNYEMVKHTIMDTAFECSDMYSLLGELDAIFAMNFEDIIADEDADDGCECGGSCCEQCDHRDCLN